MMTTNEKRVKLIEAPEDIDKKIVYLARVSSENQDNPKYEGLIKYLIKEGHWSPFDMLNVVFEINTQKDIGIQLLRHQSLKPQEWSQRYADCSDMKSELRECRLQDQDNRQNSFICDDLDLIDWWIDSQLKVQDLAFDIYEKALRRNIAKEVARSVLPIGLTETKMYFNASLRSWLFYCLSRLHMSTQKEHRKIAREVISILLEISPATVKAFSKLYFNSENYDIDGIDLLT